jgi:hypothetical protein
MFYMARLGCGGENADRPSPVQPSAENGRRCTQDAVRCAGKLSAKAGKAMAFMSYI